MKCAWEPFINLLPIWMREKVDKLGKASMQELRMRINAPPELVFPEKSVFLTRCVTHEDILFCINLATKYSPWASETITEGFITIPGGHRIGLCGAVIPDKTKRKGFSTITSVCVRISRDFQGIANDAVDEGSILIIGSPGTGKTTFLRDLIRGLSLKKGIRIAVVDERNEIFPYSGNSFCFDTGSTVDVISGCNKVVGIELVLRSMTPSVIAVDEITAESDVNAILRSFGCGVSFLATAHASGMDDLNLRPFYRSLLQHEVFQTLVILHSDMTWHLERIKI